MPFVENLGPFFREFATAAAWDPLAGGGPFALDVIFDNEYIEYPVGQAGQAGRDPQCEARDDQLAAGGGAKRGDTITIDGTAYLVDEVKPTGRGSTFIHFRE